MFNFPPVFAWVMPVFVRFQPGKEDTFSPASRSRIFVFHVPRQSKSSKDDAERGLMGRARARARASLRVRARARAVAQGCGALMPIQGDQRSSSTACQVSSSNTPPLSPPRTRASKASLEDRRSLARCDACGCVDCPTSRRFELTCRSTCCWKPLYFHEDRD